MKSSGKQEIQRDTKRDVKGATTEGSRERERAIVVVTVFTIYYYIHV